MTYFNFFIVVSIICISFAQNVDTNMLCNSKETCGECIQEKGCIWCSKSVEFLKETNNFVRCIAESEKTSEWCPDDLINNPKPKLHKPSDKPLKSATNENDQVIQFRPQKIHLKLRRNQEYKFDFQYAQGVDYPVDLYYLMDLSHSMDPHRMKLSNLGEKLAIAIRNITENFKMGFGSFVEKVTMPFVSIVPDKLKNPCNLESGCVPPYSYRNHLSLTSDSKRFTEEVKKAKTSGNLDSPEDGFDAILQSIVCQQQIGWRENATRLLVFSTDAGYHYAGDGKLAGIVEPHDGRCYLNDKGEYTHALKFDYPSISFINRHVRKHNIDLLFAVTSQVKETYTNLATRIAGAQLGILDADSENVVEIVTKVYDKLKHNLVITHTAGPDVQIDFFTKCLNSTKAMKTNNCPGIRFNEIVNFTAVIRAKSCKRQTIEIKRRSLSDSLFIDLEVDCECDCEKQGNKLFSANSPFCNSTGSLACGVCKCNPGRLGKFCECDDDTGLWNSGNTNGCKQTNSTDELVCSGRGDCKCGKCICHKGRKPGEEYSGPYCQCDNFSCRKSDNKMCSGHGICECKQCICDPGFTGAACECSLRPESCIQPGTDKRCSDHGECECGKCSKCATGYWGKYCEMCSDCPGQKCSDFVDCVECKQFPNTGKYSIEQCNFNCANYSILSVRDIDMVNNSNSDIKYKDCEHVDNNGCTMFFKHEIDMSYNIKKVYVQMEKKCPAKVDLLSLMLLVIGTIVLAGIILLVIWKIVTEVHDRREYLRFEKERQNQKWGQNDNPLYKEPTTTIKNPVYNKES